MTEQSTPVPPPEPAGPAAVASPDSSAPADPTTARPGFWQRRRDKYVAEIQRNREGGHRIPTWVLTLALVVFVAAWVAVILFS